MIALQLSLCCSDSRYTADLVLTIQVKNSRRRLIITEKSTLDTEVRRMDYDNLENSHRLSDRLKLLI